MLAELPTKKAVEEEPVVEKNVLLKMASKPSTRKKNHVNAEENHFAASLSHSVEKKRKWV